MTCAPLTATSHGGVNKGFGHKKQKILFRSSPSGDICGPMMVRVCVFVRLTEITSGRMILCSVAHMTVARYAC